MQAPERASAPSAPAPWWTPLRKLAGRVRRLFAIDLYDVFRREVPEVHGSAPVEPPEGYRFAWGTAADVEACEEFHTELDEPERRLGVRRLKLGHRVVVGFHGDRPVFTMWVNPRNLNVPGLLKRKLDGHQWFIYKAFTSPDHRGRKLYENGMRFVLNEMRASGKRELIGYAHVKKRISRKGLAALSFESVGVVRQFKAPGISWTRLSHDLACYFPEALERTGVLDGPPAPEEREGS